VSANAPSRTKILAAFAAIYLIWGSTYLGIRFAIETIPPFLMGGVRFMIAGAGLYLWMRARGGQRPSRLHWRSAAIVGGFLILGGNGAVVWAEQFVPSGMAALLVATLPFWIVLIEWVGPGHARPSLGVAVGLIVGIAGIFVLVGPAALDPSNVSGSGILKGTLALNAGSLSWALGTIYARHARLPRSAFIATGMEMLCGGALLFLLALITREPMQFDLADVSARSIAGFIYLTTIGSLVGFTAFIWLIQHQPPSRVSTYAYVNPVVAVFLGWALAGEPLTFRTLIAAAIIIGAVALITTARSSSPLPEPG
jgi:drug/metabolite transporter (DMT)-like permease